MDSVGIRELKRDASAILKRVRDDGKTIAVTYRGRSIAHIVPADDYERRRHRLAEAWKHVTRLSDRVAVYDPISEPATHELQDMEPQEVIRQMRELRDEIAANVTGPVDAVELVREQRRDLGDVRR